MATYEQLNRLTKADLKVFEGQPRFRSNRLGEALGFGRYERMRDLIARRRAELEDPDYGGPLPRIAVKSTGGRPADIELLTVTQSMLACMFSDAANAPAVRKQIISAANAWYQEHPESLPFFNALLVPEPRKTEGNVTWLPPQDEVPPEPDDECERRELARERARSAKTIEQLRLFGAQGRFAFEPPSAKKIIDEGKDDYGWHNGPQQELKPGAFVKESWTDEEKGIVCQITRRNDVDGDPFMLFFVRAGSNVFVPTELLVVDPRGNGKQIHIRLNHITPLAVVLRAYERMGHGPLSDIALATLRHFLAV